MALHVVIRLGPTAFPLRSGLAGAGAAGGDADMAEAEAFKNNLINALMHNISGAPGSHPPGMIPTPGSQPPMLMIPTPGGTGPGSARGALKQQSSLVSASARAWHGIATFVPRHVAVAAILLLLLLRLVLRRTF